MQHDGTWENRSTYTYYTELLLEMAALGIDFMHHIHMLLWANMFLSVASLILLMKLRFLYQVCVCLYCRAYVFNHVIAIRMSREKLELDFRNYSL